MHNMPRNILIALLPFLTAFNCVLHARPNVIILVADDMGYGDPSSYGGTMFDTPNIDELAKNGILFTDAYVTSPVCAPSRLGLLTGVYQQRFGVQWNPDIFPRSVPYLQLKEDQRTLPEMFRAGGYHTGIVGKWNFPREASSAADEVMYIMNFGGDFFPDEAGRYMGVDGAPFPKDPISRQQHFWREAKNEDYYLTDKIGNFAVQFIQESKTREKPFFLYVGFNAPHSPFQGKEEHKDKFGEIEPKVLALYAAMNHSMDENIGKILKKLAKDGLTENTLIFFLSDNGPSPRLLHNWPSEWPEDLTIGSAGPFSGRKAHFMEGGIRVPFIIQWKGKIEPGKFENMVSALDIFPTALAAADCVPLPLHLKLDGTNLLPFLKGEAAGREPHDSLFWSNTEEMGAVRHGDWKLLVSRNEQKYSLFNLKADPGEQTDLSATNPGIFTELKSRWHEWLKEMPEAASSVMNRSTENAQ